MTEARTEACDYDYGQEEAPPTHGGEKHHLHTDDNMLITVHPLQKLVG